MRHQPGQKIDHYEIVESLGAGAYAETYKARDDRTGQIVMLKSPNPMIFADPQVSQRFAREADVAQRLDHPGLQRSHDIKIGGDEPYLVLEYVEGETLRRRLQSFAGGVPVELALDWGRQLAEALRYLHRQGVVHRDLKPENILIDAAGRLKIVDFGTALLVGARRLTWRHLSDGVGTPDYMSPEQIKGDRGDARSDVYSWGVMMYEFLTGRPPFEGDNWMAVMAGHLQLTPRPPRELRDDIPPTIEAVVLKAMRRYPSNRYSSFDDLEADLNNLSAVDYAAFDLSPEQPIGGLSAAATDAQLWLRAALIAAVFILVLVLVIVVALLLR